MLNKIISLAIRLGATFAAVILAIIIVEGTTDVSRDIQITVYIAIWALGVIYSLYNFNNPYIFAALKQTENRISEAIESKDKKKIEEEMLRVKQLKDTGILTDEEYDIKIKSLKDKYL